MIDKGIKDTSNIICENISNQDILGVGLLSQNILAQLRNLVEYVAIKVYGSSIGEDLNDEQDNKNLAIEHIKSRGDIRFLSKFHHFLQVAKSHYVTDNDNAERLMLKYLEYLTKLRDYCKSEFALEILDNLDEFPTKVDETFIEYYSQITDKIVHCKSIKNTSNRNDRFYVQKVKPFYFEGKIYYEITLTKASDYASKFDRIIAFTDQEILSNYAIIARFHNVDIEVFGVKSRIKILDGWSVSIRVCEVNNFIRILSWGRRITYNSAEHRELNSYLTKEKINLVELIDLTDEYYERVKANIIGTKIRVTTIFDTLDICRSFSINNKPGVNTIRYLLLNMNNRILKRQYKRDECPHMSNLYLNWGCGVFEKMPFTSSLIRHNPKLRDVFEVVDVSGREHELLSRLVKNNTESKSKLYTPMKELEKFNDVEQLMQDYNNDLHPKHYFKRELKLEKKHLYINQYEDDTLNIIRELKEYCETGISGYRNFVETWLETPIQKVDDDTKEDILLRMFESSSVAFIYGSAGTGKTHLIEHISDLFKDLDVLYLANTHPAINNLKRRVFKTKSQFSTIAKYLYDENYSDCDVLVIDECSTVNNSNMRKVLKCTNFKVIILVGDIYQIESITFGNWFNICKKIFDSKSVYELESPFRTKDQKLLRLWENVRGITDKIPELLSRGRFSSVLDQSVFIPNSSDEVILCLNYDGLYGINNINAFLQNSNPNTLVEWGVNGYKVNDPILFNDSRRFTPVLYNNLKGSIMRIEEIEDKIIFDIEVDEAIHEMQIDDDMSLELISNENQKSVVRFSVNAYRNSDEDEDESSRDSIVPFQIAYSVSIHKAQGLEYESVKIILTNEVEEMISHNIFYTAITRSKKHLKIYWSPNTQEHILNNLVQIDDNKDFFLIRDKI